MNKLLVYTLFLIGFFASGVSANSANDWRINGFISQGLSSTSDNNYFGHSDDSVSFDFFEAGLLLQRDISDTLSVSAKLAYRAPYSIQSQSTNIDHLLLDYHALKGRDWYAGVRLGRTKFNHGLYNTARDTSYTWPTALMNDTLYTNKLLPLYLATDGLNLYGHRDFGNTSIDLEFSNGRADVPSGAVEDLFYGFSESRDITFKGIINAKLAITQHSWGSRFNVTFTEIDKSTEGANEVSFRIREHALSWQQTWGDWQLDLELSQMAIDNNLGLEVPTSRSYNMTLHRLLASGLDAYILIGELWNDPEDKQGHDFEAMTGRPGSINYSANYGLGFIYPLAPHWDIAAEVRYNEGTQSLLIADNPPLGDGLKEHWTQLFVRATFHF